MSNAHKGLTEIAKKAKLTPDELRQGEFILFTNKAFTACKLLAPGNVLVHYKHPKGHPLDYRALKLIPQFFDGKDIKYPQALRHVFREYYPKLFHKAEEEALEES
jgi:hypothetical protein